MNKAAFMTIPAKPKTLNPLLDSSGMIAGKSGTKPGSQVHISEFDRVKLKYRILFELSVLASLTLIIILLRYFPSFKSDSGTPLLRPNITVEISDIPETHQTVSSKGQPVKPVIPIAGNITEELLYDDESNLGTEFGLLPIPAPPPPPGNKTKTEYQPPRLIVSKFPEYPKELQKQGVSGTIILEVKVDVDGKVVDHRIKSNTTHNKTLEKLAVETVYKCRYMPATENKSPSVAWTDHKFEFMDKQPN